MIRFMFCDVVDRHLHSSPVAAMFSETKEGRWLSFSRKNMNIKYVLEVYYNYKNDGM